jgi:hypothetical protein
MLAIVSRTLLAYLSSYGLTRQRDDHLQARPVGRANQVALGLQGNRVLRLQLEVEGVQPEFADEG